MKVRYYKDPEGVIYESTTTVVDKIDGTLCVLLKPVDAPYQQYVMPFHYLYEKRIINGEKVNSFEYLGDTYPGNESMNTYRSRFPKPEPEDKYYDYYNG